MMIHAVYSHGIGTAISICLFPCLQIMLFKELICVVAYVCTIHGIKVA